MVKASLNDYRQSPRKVRLVANLVKGKQADTAIALLSFTVKEAAASIKKLIESGVANAKNNFNIESADLYIKDIQVNPGLVMKRSMPRARGSAYQIKKRTSHIDLILDVKVKKEKAKKEKKVQTTKK